jgi:ankyrin repeat protein
VIVFSKFLKEMINFRSASPSVPPTLNVNPRRDRVVPTIGLPKDRIPRRRKSRNPHIQICRRCFADVNVQSGYYGNALQAAAANGHKAVVQLLIEKGADSGSDAEDEDGTEGGSDAEDEDGTEAEWGRSHCEGAE